MIKGQQEEETSMCSYIKGSCLRALPGGRTAPLRVSVGFTRWCICNTQVRQSYSIKANRPGADGRERGQATFLLTQQEQAPQWGWQMSTSCLKVMVVLTAITEEFNTVNKIHLTLTFRFSCSPNLYSPRKSLSKGWCILGWPVGWSGCVGALVHGSPVILKQTPSTVYILFVNILG